MLMPGEAVVKSYALPGEDDKPFLAYLVPKEGDDATVVDNDQPRQVSHLSHQQNAVVCRPP